jgi:hypothetical protein
MSSINATNARKNLYKLIKEVGESHEPVTITEKDSSAVRDAKKISRAGLKKNVTRLPAILEENPYRSPPVTRNYLAISKVPTREGSISSLG